MRSRTSNHKRATAVPHAVTECLICVEERVEFILDQSLIVLGFSLFAQVLLLYE